MGFELHDPEALLATLRSFPKETDWVEFKANKFDSEAVGRYVSGLANAAMFQRQKLAYMVWGVADGTHEIVGTTVRLESETVGAEAFLLWLNKYVRPKINVHHCPFDLEGKHIEMLVIEPGYQQPVSFSGENIFASQRVWFPCPNMSRNSALSGRSRPAIRSKTRPLHPTCLPRKLRKNSAWRRCSAYLAQKVERPQTLCIY